MTNDAFAMLLLAAAIPAGIAGGITGVWIARWAVVFLLPH